MKSKHSIVMVMTLAFAHGAGADTAREEATHLYLDALAESLGEEASQTSDAEAAMEGMSDGSMPDDLTPGYMIIEGDIQVSIEEWEAFLADPSRAVFGTVNYWGSAVPYDFAANLFDDPQDPGRRQAAIDAMNAISARVGVVFQPRAAEADWIRFQESGFNNSPVGRQGGMQIINIVSWGTQIIIVHELYHSLGFWHEQSATDRDTYVTINYGNVCGSSGVPGNPCHPNVCQQCSDGGGGFTSCAYNFDIRAGAGLWGPYDFDSFMHYPRWAFSCTGNDTITVNAPWNAQWQNAIGQRDHFSLIDELSCRGIYPFFGDRWLRAGAGGTNAGTFFNPFNGTFTTACNATPQYGTLLIDPGTYSGVGVYGQPKIIRATYATVTIGN